MKTNTPWITTAAAVAIGLGGLTYVVAEGPAIQKPAPKVSVADFRAKLKKDDAPLPNNGQMVMSYANVAEKILPCVVRITSSIPMKTPSMGQIPPMWRDFFRRFGLPEDGGGGFGSDDEEEPQPQPRGRGGRQQQPPKERPSQKGMGSGVIISPDGYILTNNHVVEDAEKIEVNVGADSKTYKAKVIGTDPLTDVAVIKIEGVNLPVATLGDSSKLRVGDVVLAAGNPMELSQSISMGIVSALGRSGMHIVHQGDGRGIENFIQTDAAINPGNSGGPLVDALGRVVGINTAIMTRSGMNSGIGFTIPINLALRVGEDLIDDGKVSRGFLGVVMGDLLPDDAKAMGLGEESGVLVKEVREGAPASKAGVQDGDVIVSIGGQRVENSAALRSLVASSVAGTNVDIVVLRDNKRVTLKATLTSATDEEIESRRVGMAGNDGAKPADNGKFIKGVTAKDVDPLLRKRYEIPEGVSGTVIVAVEPNTPAAQSGLEEGDVIISINNKPVADTASARKLAKDSEGVMGVRVSRKGSKQFIVIREDGKNE